MDDTDPEHGFKLDKLDHIGIASWTIQPFHTPGKVIFKKKGNPNVKQEPLNKSTLKAWKIIELVYLFEIKVRAIQNFPASRKSTFYYFYIKKHQKWWIKVTSPIKVLPFLIGDDF